jgi:D-xylose transport system substrate-binding protein
MDQWVKDWQPTEAMKLVENALTGAHNNVQAILAPNDGTASGCIRALAAQGLAGKVPVTGQDAELAAAQRIVAGTQSMTVFKDTRALARETFKIAVAMANGATPDAVATQVVNNNKIDVPSVLLTPVIVTKDNIDEVLVESGYLKRADVYKYAK